LGLLVFIIIFCGLWIFRIPQKLIGFVVKLPSFFYWFFRDVRNTLKNGKRFNYYGLKIFCGRQGAGKTMGLVWFLEKVRKEFPKSKIYTNFGYDFEDGVFHDWHQLVDGSMLNGEDGVVIGWDEIQNDFSSTKFKDFPDHLLSAVTQQRKQKMCILATSQVYTRVVKSLREQCFDVVECKTFFNRWTRLRCYDADDYNGVVDNPTPQAKFKLPKKWSVGFIQSDYLRGLYDSYAQIRRMATQEFVPRNERIHS